MPDDTLLELALVGARARGFNHDTASKLQRLMMATSEAEELAGPTASPDHQLAIESLRSALAELESLFVEFRLLAQGTQPVLVDLARACAQAAMRANVEIELAVATGLERPARGPELVQALASLLDALASPRAIPITGTGVSGGQVELAIAAGPTASDRLTAALALVTHVLARTGGTVSRDSLAIRLTI